MANEAVVNGVNDEVPSWWESEGPVPDDHDNSCITHNWFPNDFLFGTATAAFQVEGAAAKGGRGISIWDEFSRRLPWKIEDGSNGNVACDMYTRYKEDIQMMKQMGFNSYRFSISWPRILPGGRCSGGVNREGIDYYNDLINTVLHHGMEPLVTLFHWDLPICFEKEYGGFLSKKINGGPYCSQGWSITTWIFYSLWDDFREFAEVCFWEFGDRVKHWTTINEPYTYAVYGYVKGNFPPGHKLPSPNDNHLLGSNSPTIVTPAGDKFIMAQTSEGYEVGRNILLAHAEVVDLYRSKFQKSQGGKICIVLNSHWFMPFDENSQDDKDACGRALDFMLGWFLEPVLSGDYPITMKNCVPPDRLPSFTNYERDMLKGSIDFLGLNYYTSMYASNDPNPTESEGYDADQRVKFDLYRDNKPIGTPSGLVWLFSVPKGIYELLVHLDEAYPDLKEIYITENGYPTKSDPKKTAKMVCNDDKIRTKHHQDHLADILKAMKHIYYKNDCINTKVKGYFVWSWCDNYEWAAGYTIRFGLVYIDYINDLTRYPKDSAAWFAEFLKSKEEPPSWFHPSWPKAALLAEKRSHEENGETGTGKRQKVVVENVQD